jgi:class 3 adenylate cyclase/tetratricopeptide (TPR) repeat protein
MKGFTRLSEITDPEEMDTLMDQIFAAFESVVLRFDGTVEKYIGDALVAVFGAPKIHEDDPTRAVSAALDFQSELRHLNRSLRKRDVELVFRTGINTGLVTTGKRGQFEVVTGHTMSLASRLEAAAPPAGVLVAESTKEKCENDFVFSDPVRVQPQGADDPVIAYKVLGRRRDPFHLDEVFLDREEQLARMTKRFLKHNSEETDGFYVLGPAGIGKTALAKKFIEKVRQYPDYDSAVLHARARPYRRTSFSVIRDLVLNYLNIENTRDTEAVRNRLARDLGVEDSTAGEFAALLSGSTTSHIDNQAFVLLYVVLKHVLAKHERSPYPVVVFIDNASLVDRQSRDFFQFFQKNANIRPFFVFTDRRPDPLLGELFKELERLSVDPLEDQDARDYLHILRPDLENDAIVDRILGESQGNPLFIREYARHAKDTAAAGAVPTTIQNILLTSVDSFEAELRDLLKKLSVFFHSFSLEDARFIQERTEGNPEIVPTAISFFLNEGLIVEERGIYSFSHDLLKHALYNSILNYNKKILHRLIAERMQEAENPHLFRLLDHLLRAEEYDAADEVLQTAPDLTINLEYLKYFDTLLDHAESESSESVIRHLFMKSAILFNNGLTESADSTLKQIVTMAVAARNSAYLARAYHILCAFNMKAYSFQKASFCARKAISYYRDAADHPNRHLNAQNVLGILAMSEALRNNMDEAVRCLEEAAEQEQSNELALANNWAEYYLLRGMYQKSEEILEPYSDEDPGNRRHGDWLSTCFLRVLTLWHLCEFEKLKSVVEQLEHNSLKNYANFAQVYAYLAVACDRTGESGKTADYLQQAEFFALQTNNDFDGVDTLRTLAETRLILGRHEEAERAALEGLSIALRNTAFYPGFSLLMILTELATERRTVDDARFFLSEATFLIESQTTLRNRDRVLYHYFMSSLNVDGDPDRHLEQASRLLAEERENMGNADRFETLMTLRSFPRVRRELM